MATGTWGRIPKPGPQRPLHTHHTLSTDSHVICTSKVCGCWPRFGAGKAAWESRLEGRGLRWGPYEAQLERKTESHEERAEEGQKGWGRE